MTVRVRALQIAHAAWLAVGLGMFVAIDRAIAPWVAWALLEVPLLASALFSLMRK